MNFQAPDFYLMGSISTCRSNSQFSKFFETSACTYYHDEKTISLLHPSYQSVLAEFSRLLSTYIVFSGRASFNWAVDCPGLVLFLTGPAHHDNGAQRSSRSLLASGLPALVIFCLTTSAGSFFTESNTQPSSIFLLKRMSYIRFLISTYSFTSSYTRIIILKTHKIPFSYLHPYFCCFSHPALIFLPLVFP